MVVVKEEVLVVGIQLAHGELLLKAIEQEIISELII
jgi:hypothetical protein